MQPLPGWSANTHQLIVTVNVQRYIDVNLCHDLLHSYTVVPVALNRLAPFPTISPFIFCTLSWFPELCYFNLPPPSNKFQLPPWKRFLHTLTAERGLEPQQDRLHKKSNNTLLHMFWVRDTVSLETWQSRQVHLLTLRVFSISSCIIQIIFLLRYFYHLFGFPLLLSGNYYYSWWRRLESMEVFSTEHRELTST